MKNGGPNCTKFEPGGFASPKGAGREPAPSETFGREIIIGGETGIRTLGTLARSTVFETAPIDHSGTSPGE